jgi:hypothetical protein
MMSSILAIGDSLVSKFAKIKDQAHTGMVLANLCSERGVCGECQQRETFAR